jgi:multidrug efflux pump subunit AcrA (membrane-fusion protein)
VRFQALPGREFPGEVTLSSWALDPQARTVMVEIHLPNTPKEELRPGMYANVTISVDVPDILTLPSDVLLTDGDNTYCYVVEDGKAVRTVVRVGVQTKAVTQVLQKQGKSANAGDAAKWENFTGQEQIVAQNPGSLIDGQAVTAGSPSLK